MVESEINKCVFPICIYHRHWGLCRMGYKTLDWIKAFNKKAFEMGVDLEFVRISGSNTFVLDYTGYENG